MKRFRIHIARTYTSFFDGNEMQRLKKEDLRASFDASLVFTHTHASGYNGRITKFLNGEGKTGKCHMDDIIHKFNHFPRKQKKRVKKYVSAAIEKYKRED